MWISGGRIDNSARRSVPKKADVGMLLVAALAREGLASCTIDADRVGRAWSMAHGHSWVQHPGRSRLPGHKVAVGTIFLQIAAFIMAPPLFLFVFGFSSPGDLVSVSCALCSLGSARPPA